MSNTFIICAAVVFCVAVIAAASSQYHIEAAKQDAFMMKACVDAGGQWEKNWRQIPSCLRPQH
jgi:hypothetical protein